MTVRELYDYAKDRDIADYEIEVDGIPTHCIDYQDDKLKLIGLSSSVEGF